MKMTPYLIFLLGLLVASVVISLYVRTRWIRVAIAVVVLCAQFQVLAVTFDLHARAAIESEMASGQPIAVFSRAVAELKERQLADRIIVGLLSMGLFSLIVFGSSSRTTRSNTAA